MLRSVNMLILNEYDDDDDAAWKHNYTASIDAVYRMI